MENINTRVAISMAILAGLLAVVSLFGSKSSGNMITYQAQANHLQAQANMSRTKATDTWSYFQAKTLRKHMYRISSDILHSLNVETQLQKEWINAARRYDIETSDLKIKAIGLDEEADKLQKRAQLNLDLSVKENEKADLFDLSRLCAEIGLVLCSIALVSKRKFLWVLGIFFGFASLGIFSSNIAFSCGYASLSLF